MNNDKSLVKLEGIAEKIFFIRGEKVMLDFDLAELYGVLTGNLKRAVKRNIERFPRDFMFQLTKEEFDNLRCQFGISSWGGTRHTQMAFTEQGVAMLSGVLKSKRAVEVNIAIMRTFVQLRKLMSINKDLEERINSLEGKYDEKFQAVFTAIKRLIRSKTDRSKKPIGFRVDE